MRFLALFLLVSLATPSAAPAAPGVAPVSVSIKEVEGLYAVSGSFEVRAGVDTVWSVLTDYDGIQEFVKSVKKSVVIEREPDHVLLEQVGVGKVLFFSKHAQVVLRVTEQAHHSIRFRDVGGKDFKSYDGGWDLDRTGDSVRVSYFLNAELKARRPAFLVRGAMNNTARHLLEEVRAEIDRRSAASRVSSWTRR